MVWKRELALPKFGAPNLRSPIIRARQNELSIRGECQGGYEVLVAVQTTQLEHTLAAPTFHHLCCRILGANDDVFPVRRKRNRCHRSNMWADRQEAHSTLRAPDLRARVA